jgi:hypothetical protein
MKLITAIIKPCKPELAVADDIVEQLVEAI